MISWKEKYAVGNKIIDEQHKVLFDLCDKIMELQQNNYIIDKFDRITELITELVDYTTFHFHEEEAYMRRINYPGYEEQKAEHDEFTEKLLDVNLKDIDENQDKYINHLLVFVLDWLSNHIINKDMLIK
jgi:hemerythrin